MANWIKGAIKKPGALHEDLGVAKGKKIPYSLVAKAASGSMGPKTAKRARLAMTLRKMNRG